MELENNNLKYTFLYSPRTNYNMKLETEQNLYIDLVKSFDPYSIKIIKKHFKEHLGILNKETFICILKNHLLSWNLNLPHRETMIIKLLSRLFDEIDINSTGEVQWSDFVNYIINLSKKRYILCKVIYKVRLLLIIRIIVKIINLNICLLTRIL